MNAIPSLPNVFPELWNQVEQLAQELTNGTHVDWPALIARLDFLEEAESIDALDAQLPGWKKIAIIRGGITAKHTILVLATCLNLPEYRDLSPQAQLELQWAALFHDIDKDGSEGRDATHPFRSAAIATRAMIALGFEPQPETSPGDIEKWADLVLSAQSQVDGQVVHDHAHLGEIIEGIHRLWGRDSSTGRILKAVLFHQSLPMLKDWINPVLLNNNELRASLTLDDLDVLAPLLIADSDSWNVFDKARLAYLDELRANIAKTRGRLGG